MHPHDEHDPERGVKPILRIITPAAARERMGEISRSTEQRLIKSDPDWPKKIHHTRGCSGYIESELEAYIAKKLVERDAGAVSAHAERGRALGKSNKGRPPGNRS
jgi:predicted DNA-binding transcriptional regulator AlpA